MKKTPRVPLAIYRIKDSFEEEIFRSNEDLKADGATIKRFAADFSDLEANLIIKTPRTKLPTWTSFVSTIAPASQAEINPRAMQSAAVELRHGASRYAITFGHGRMLLLPEAVERGFGLRCALDLISKESMLSVGYKQVDHTTLFSNVQANRRVGFESFHVDTEASILSGILGRPDKDEPRYSKALGKDALHVNPRLLGDEASLLDFVVWVDDVYSRKGYKKKGYEWIDQISVVTDALKIAALESRLDGELTSEKRKTSQLWFGPPGLVDYEDIESLSIQGTRSKTVADVTLAEIRKARSSKLSVADLKKAYIRGHDASGQRVKDWRAFDWVNWETSLDDDTVILQGGVFYLVDKSFETRIDRRIKDLNGIPDEYPDWKDRQENEDEVIYNKKLAKTLKRSKFLDKTRFFKSFQGHGELELCDVLVKGETSEPTTLVFVKKYNGSSAPLSHLFAQGPNSIDTVLADERFRAEIREKVRGYKYIFSKRAPAPGSLAMSFVILTKGKRKELTQLPFFSKLSLYRASKWADSHGVKLTVGTRAMAV